MKSDKTKPNCFSNGMKKTMALTFAALALLPAALFAKEIKLTTYYPSPYGEYKSVKLVPQASEPVACAAAQLGALYTDAVSKALLFCNGTEWVPIGTGTVGETNLGGYSHGTWTWNTGSGTGTGWENVYNGWVLDEGNYNYKTTLYYSGGQSYAF